MQNNIEILKYVVAKLEENNITTNDKVIQTVMFFLKECGLPISYKFNMNDYGYFDE